MNLEFERFYKLSMVCLRLIGAHPAVPRNWKLALHFYLMYGYYAVYSAFSVINLVFSDTKNINIDKACVNITLVLIYITVTVQHVVMMGYREHIKTLIKTQQNNFEIARLLTVEEQKIVKYYANRGRWSSKLWFACTCFALIIQPVKGMIQTIQYFYWNHELKLYPIDQNTYPFGIEEIKFRLDVFIFLYFLRMLHGAYNIITYTGFTPLGPIFVLNTCGQVELVIKQATRLFSEEDFDREATKNAMTKIIRDMHHIYSCIKIINNIFEAFYEQCLKVTPIAIPVALILVILIWKHTGVWGMNYMAYAVGPLILCFEICYYCDILVEKGEELRQAIYACGWDKHYDGTLRKVLIIMLTRTMMPMAIKTPFRTLCLDTFSQACFQTYSIFNVMNAMLK